LLIGVSSRTFLAQVVWQEKCQGLKEGGYVMQVESSQCSIALLAMGVVLGLLTAGSTFAFEEDLVAAWTLDEGKGDVVNDISGNENHGVLKGAEWVKEGKFGSSAIRFGKGVVDIPMTDSLHIHGGDVTLALWLKLEEAADNVTAVVQKDVGGTGRVWAETHTEEIVNWLGQGRNPSGIIAEVGRWYHYAVVIEAADRTIQMYIDGQAEGPSAKKALEDSVGDFRLGSHKQDGQNPWPGLLDDVALFKKALSDAEIQGLMTKGIGGVLVVDAMDKLASTWGRLKRK
jgi:hypothetical protein